MVKIVDFEPNPFLTNKDAANSLVADVYCDRGDEDDVAVYVQWKGISYLFSTDFTLEGTRKRINIERYFAVYFARSLGITHMRLHINGFEELEDDLEKVLNRDFSTIQLDIVGKAIAYRAGFRVTSELLYLCKSMKFHTQNIIKFSAENKEPLEINDIITALNKPYLQPVIMKFLTKNKHEVSRYSDAFFWFEFAFYVRSIAVVMKELRGRDIEYNEDNLISEKAAIQAVEGPLVAKKPKKSKTPTKPKLQELFEVNIEEGVEEKNQIPVDIDVIE